MSKVILKSEAELPLVYRGKVRDVYEQDEGLVFVATDRLSAFDVVFNQGIPNKGEVLTQLSLFWADKLKACKPFHLITEEWETTPTEQFKGRSMLVERLDMLPVECVVRGYLVGSGWKDYCATGMVCGHQLPTGMKQGDAFPSPIFTPATKAELGDHDENISFERAVEILGAEVAEEVRDRSLEIFTEASKYAMDKGLVLVDTKFEFGRRADGTIVLADEILTPDSSRYWDLEQARSMPEGEVAPSFDKQVVRNYLETLDWDKTPPPPELPDEIISLTRERYLDLYKRLTGKKLV